MPLHYYHKRILKLLGQIIGKVLRIDYNTESATRGKFARIAVDVELNKPLVSQFLLDGKLQRIEYESLPSICFECGKYGHILSECPDKKNAAIQPENTVLAQISDGLDTTATAPPRNADKISPLTYGPWMMVTEKGSSRHIKELDVDRGHDRSQQGNFRGGSRFSILANDVDSDGSCNCSIETPKILPEAFFTR